MISRAELGRHPIQLKVHSQRIKYFLRLAGGTSCDISNDTFKFATEANSQWIQNVSRLLRHNGFSEVANSPSIVSRNTFHKVFFSRLKDCCLQEVRYSTLSRIKEYIKLGADRTKYDFHNFLEDVKNIEHRRVIVRL